MHDAPVFLTLISAVLGVFGKTWEPDRAGIKRVTWKGWTVILLAVISSVLTIKSTAQDRAEKASYRAVALAEIVLATDRLLDPFRSLYVAYKGPGFIPQTGAKPEREGLAQLRTAVTAQALVSNEFLAHLGQTDILSLSGEIRQGKQLAYLDHIAVRTEEGRVALEKALTLGGDLLPTGIRTSALTVIQSPYTKASEARPAAIRRLPSTITRTILPAASSTQAGVIAEYKAFVELVNSLNAAASQAE